MKSIPKAAYASVVMLLLALAPASAMASKTARVARTRDVVYRDRTPRVHDETPRKHPRRDTTTKLK